MRISRLKVLHQPHVTESVCALFLVYGKGFDSNLKGAVHKELHNKRALQLSPKVDGD